MVGWSQALPNFWREIMVRLEPGTPELSAGNYGRSKPVITELLAGNTQGRVDSSPALWKC
jgi:hypothetical protein